MGKVRSGREFSALVPKTTCCGGNPRANVQVRPAMRLPLSRPIEHKRICRPAATPSVQCGQALSFPRTVPALHTTFALHYYHVEYDFLLLLIYLTSDLHLYHTALHRSIGE